MFNVSPDTGQSLDRTAQNCGKIPEMEIPSPNSFVPLYLLRLLVLSLPFHLDTAWGNPFI